MNDFSRMHLKRYCVFTSSLLFFNVLDIIVVVMFVESVFGRINIFVPSKSIQIDFSHFLQAHVFAITTMVSLETVKSSIVGIIGT